jgi:hypothetical protein
MDMLFDSLTAVPAFVFPPPNQSVSQAAGLASEVEGFSGEARRSTALLRPILRLLLPGGEAENTDQEEHQPDTREPRSRAVPEADAEPEREHAGVEVEVAAIEPA